jgi:tRNA dimethylallyltransferase
MWHRRASYRVVQLAICPSSRDILHRRIALRFEAMMAAGLVEEVRCLWKRPDLHSGLPAVRAVGYRQLWRYLDGELSLDEAVSSAVAATRQLAKRQLTWLRKWPHLAWIYTDYAGNLASGDSSASHLEGRELTPVDMALNYLGQPPL